MCREGKLKFCYVSDSGHDVYICTGCGCFYSDDDFMTAPEKKTLNDLFFDVRKISEGDA